MMHELKTDLKAVLDQLSLEYAALMAHIVDIHRKLEYINHVDFSVVSELRKYQELTILVNRRISTFDDKLEEINRRLKHNATYGGGESPAEMPPKDA